MQPLAEGAVGNLIVILQIADERHAGEIERRRPTRLLLPPVPLPLVHVAVLCASRRTPGATLCSPCNRPRVGL